MSQILAAGSVAPDFSLRVTPDQKLSRIELRGKPGHPRILSRRLEPGLRRSDGFLQRSPARVQTARVTAPGHLRGRRLVPRRPSPTTDTCTFPLLADFEPKGAVAEQYGVYREADGNPDGPCSSSTRRDVIRLELPLPRRGEPGADGILEALESMKK